MDKILSGEKTSEFKGAGPFWNKRLGTGLEPGFREGNVRINFLCGQKAYKYEVSNILLITSAVPQKIDDEYHKQYWEIVLGDRIQ